MEIISSLSDHQPKGSLRHVIEPEAPGVLLRFVQFYAMMMLTMLDISFLRIPVIVFPHYPAECVLGNFGDMIRGRSLMSNERVTDDTLRKHWSCQENFFQCFGSRVFDVRNIAPPHPNDVADQLGSLKRR